MATQSKSCLACRSELLFDVARIAGKSSGDDDMTSELMQAASDPLLLRAALGRRQLEVPRSVGLRTPDLLVCPGAPGQNSLPTSGHRRFAVEPVFITSLRPERFVSMPDQFDEEESGVAFRSRDLFRKFFFVFGLIMLLAFHLLSA